MHFVHIDTEPDSREIYRRVLLEGGHTLQGFGDYDQAREWLSHQQCDAILTGLGSKPQESVRTVEALRAAYPTVPLVVLTSLGDDSVWKIAVLDAGAAGYVSKFSSLTTAYSEILAAIASFRG